jgi:hypothetical protein
MSNPYNLSPEDAAALAEAAAAAIAACDELERFIEENYPEEAG